MRSIPNPNYVGSDVYLHCVSSIGIEPLRTNLASVAPTIAAGFADYLAKAITADLYLIPPDHSSNDAMYLGFATKQNFKDVYSQQMVGANKPGRAIYDALIASAPGDKCPFCGFGQVKTLDHYLPKAKYPQYSVFPANLVPACNDCNFAKRTGLPTTKGDQTIHPYFDGNLISEQWLFATVVPGNPLSIQYFANAPAHWNQVEKDRVSKHFNTFGLQGRFAIEASDELASLRNTLRRVFVGVDSSIIKAELLAQANDRFALHKNSWQTALFQALANSDWYCQGGHQNI